MPLLAISGLTGPAASFHGLLMRQRQTAAEGPNIAVNDPGDGAEFFGKTDSVDLARLRRCSSGQCPIPARDPLGKAQRLSRRSNPLTQG